MNTTQWTMEDLVVRDRPWSQDETRLAAIERALIDVDAVPDPERHPWFVEMFFQTRFFRVTCHVQGHEAINLLIDQLFNNDAVLGHKPIISVLPAVKPRPHGAYDNQLVVDLDSHLKLGAVKCDTVRGEHPGTWLTWSRSLAPHAMNWHDCTPAENAFPTNAAVGYEAIRSAVHEFYDLDGGGLPRSLDWQKALEDVWA